MSNPKILTAISKNALIIFFICLFVFALSLVPISYSAGYSNALTGAGGIGSTPPSDQVTIPKELVLTNYYMTVASAIIGSLSLLGSGIANARKASLERNTEEMKYKTSQLQYEMQMKEIEKLRLELMLEKKGNKKREK